MIEETRTDTVIRVRYGPWVAEAPSRASAMARLWAMIRSFPLWFPTRTRILTMVVEAQDD